MVGLSLCTGRSWTIICHHLVAELARSGHCEKEPCRTGAKQEPTYGFALTTVARISGIAGTRCQCWEVEIRSEFINQPKRHGRPLPIERIPRSTARGAFPETTKDVNRNSSIPSTITNVFVTTRSQSKQSHPIVPVYEMHVQLVGGS